MAEQESNAVLIYEANNAVNHLNNLFKNLANRGVHIEFNVYPGKNNCHLLKPDFYLVGSSPSF